MVAGLEVGADDYVSKPLTRLLARAPERKAAKLTGCLHDASREGRHIDESIAEGASDEARSLVAFLRLTRLREPNIWRTLN